MRPDRRAPEGARAAPGCQAWYDRKIRPGDEWNAEISKHLEDADIILLLVSANFFASEYCGLEAERAMERHDSGSTVVVPVMLHPYNLAGGSFAKLNALPPRRSDFEMGGPGSRAGRSVQGIEEIAPQAARRRVEEQAAASEPGRSFALVAPPVQSHSPARRSSEGAPSRKAESPPPVRHRHPGLPAGCA